MSTQADTNVNVIRRRNIRKGTFSCWPCKRRKTKCVKHGSSAVCITCQRRGTACVGQDNADPTESSHVDIEERIVHVESLVNQLAHQRTTQSTSARRLDGTDGGNGDDDFLREIMHPADHLPSLLTTAHKLFPGSRSLSCQLYAILPHPTKAALILTRGKFSNLPIHARGQASRKTTSSVTDPGQLAQAFEPPSPTAHPIQFARKLIQLALCLHQLENPIYDAARRYLEIASRYVTSQDCLMDSLDGIETLILECCYYVNTGDIHRAWLVIRRALSIAQLLGLPKQKMQADCREENIWFRLMLGDRSFSWMLGLPLAVADDTFASQEELVADAWSAKLDRVHSAILGRIITRNVRMQRRPHLEKDEDNAYDDCKVTQDIDHELKQPARSLPIAWWSCPSLINGCKDLEAMEKTTKLIAQMHHYFFLVILHQPYLVRKPHLGPTTSSDVSARVPFDPAYSQSVVLSASREVLSRFLVLRNFHRTLSYRGVDDKVFIVAMMFLVIHINGQCLGSANVLEHQRPHDLGIINDVVSLFKETSSANQDTLSISMAHGLAKLLEVEAEAANGRKYSIWMEDATDERKFCKITEDEDGLRLPISYFGLIRIAPQEISSANLGFGSFDTEELAPESSATTGGKDIPNSLDDYGDTGVPSMSSSHLHPVVFNDESIGYDEHVDLSLRLDPDIQDVSQKSVQLLQRCPQADQTDNLPTYANQEADATLLDSWLTGGSLAELNQEETDMWTIES